jgi:tetratricopeptide (TPR) repeat protein
MARIKKQRAAGSRANARGVSGATAKSSTQSPAAAKRRSGAIEDTMFFPRLRRHSKWMFLLLALFFGLGFVLFGVGASGTGLGDLFRNHQGGGSSNSINSALKATAKNPRNAKAWQDLATAYEIKGDIDLAINAQSQYTLLAPSDLDGLNQLAGLYRAQAQKQATIAQDAQIKIAYSGTVSPAGSGLVVKGSPIFTDPLAAPLTSEASATYQTAIQNEQQALQSQLATYQKVAQKSPKDPNAQLAIANAARDLGSTPEQIAAYRRFLVLAPDDANAPLVRKQLKQLTKPAKTTPKAKPTKAKSG